MYAPSNPYAPPVVPQSYPPPGWGQQGYGAAGYAREAYVPLATRATLAQLGIIAACLASFALDGTQLAFAEDLGSAEPSLAASLALAGAGLAVLGANILAAILFCVWVHRAAKNLPALGRGGLQFTPGWAVGWWFVPFANLVKPFHVMSEVWRASDPDAQGAEEWKWAPRTGLLGLWWGTWLVSNAIGNVSGRIDAPTTSGAVGLVGSVLSLVAGIVCVVIVSNITKRQAQRALATTR